MMRQTGTDFKEPVEVGVERVSSEYYAGGQATDGEQKQIDGTRPEDAEEGGIGVGAIIGIIVGVLVLVAVIGGVVFMVMRNKKA
jgi:hypothetical protein